MAPLIHVVKLRPTAVTVIRVLPLLFECGIQYTIRDKFNVRNAFQPLLQ